MQQNVQRVVGVICLIIGIILLVRGHDMAASIGNQAQQFFTGAPSNRSTYFYIAGIALTIFGASQIVWPAKPKS
jgi:preprotein translocase subunit SecG